MSIFGDLCLKCLKTSVKFEISSFKKGYMKNFVKIRKLIFFGLKCPYFGLLARNFQKQMTNLKSIHSKYHI